MAINHFYYSWPIAHQQHVIITLTNAHNYILRDVFPRKVILWVFSQPTCSVVWVHTVRLLAPVEPHQSAWSLAGSMLGESLRHTNINGVCMCVFLCKQICVFFMLNFFYAHTHVHTVAGFTSVLLPLVLVGHQSRLVVCLRCVAYHHVIAWRALAVCCRPCT